MLVQTKYFGEIDLDEERVITFESGLLGLEDFKRFTLLYNDEGGERPVISWMQSLDEPLLALPVMIPTIVMPDYNPIVEDEVLKPLGELTEENISILVTVTVPPDLTKMSTNMKAPLIINTDTMKGCQVAVENTDYEIKHYIYDYITAAKEQKGGSAC